MLSFKPFHICLNCNYIHRNITTFCNNCSLFVCDEYYSYHLDGFFIIINISGFTAITAMSGITKYIDKIISFDDITKYLILC